MSKLTTVAEIGQARQGIDTHIVTLYRRDDVYLASCKLVGHGHTVGQECPVPYGGWTYDRAAAERAGRRHLESYDVLTIR